MTSTQITALKFTRGVLVHLAAQYPDIDVEPQIAAVINALREAGVPEKRARDDKWDDDGV